MSKSASYIEIKPEFFLNIYSKSAHGAETFPTSPLARVKVPLARLATKFREKFLTSPMSRYVNEPKYSNLGALLFFGSAAEMVPEQKIIELTKVLISGYLHFFPSIF